MVTQPLCCDLNENSFSQQVLRSPLPVLVLVSLNGLDQQLQKMLDERAALYQGHLKIFQLNTNHPLPWAQKWGIPHTPGFAIFHKGAMYYQFIGQASRRDFDELFARVSVLCQTIEVRVATVGDSFNSGSHSRGSEAVGKP